MRFCSGCPAGRTVTAFSRSRETSPRFGRSSQIFVLKVSLPSSTSEDELLALRDYIDSKIETVPQEKQTETTYVLNKNTMKFHLENCSSVKSIKDKHRSTYTGSRDELIARGYAPCKKCHPNSRMAGA